MTTSGHDLDRSAIVLYGTETGTSQDLAEEIGRCLERLFFDSQVVELDTVSYRSLPLFDIAVFVVSTTGQGDFPANARKFWTSLLRKKLSATTLSGIDYAVVGLGDSSYPQFNFAARKLDKRLKQLGARPLLDACEADEQGDEGTDGAFLSWLPTFRNTLLARFPLPHGLEPIPKEALLPSKRRLAPAPAVGQSSPNAQPSPNAQSQSTVTSSDSFSVVLEQNKRVTPREHWQDVRFLSLRTSRPIDYMPGDALAISPRNMPEDVATLIMLMNWEEMADVPLILGSTRKACRASKDLSPPNPFPHEEMTVRKLLTEYLDINAIPRRSFFAAIAHYTSDAMHKERLLEFTDPQYLDEYYDYATRPRRSILEILQEFDTVKIPWEEATNVFPTLRPRQFSIASGGALKHADGSTRFELLVAIVKYRTIIRRIREGVCTKYLAQLPVGTTLQVSLKTEGRFSTAADLAGKSHILIGAGTGIAPLRALIHEKAWGPPSGADTVLIFGCRNEKADYFFHDEWSLLSGTSTSGNGPCLPLRVITAFSRDQRAKMYVQDRVREHGELLWRLLRHDEATVIVCGASGQMPKAVRQALVDVLVTRGTTTRTERGDRTGREGTTDKEGESEEHIETDQDAERYLARLEKVGRYKQETWS